MNRVLKYLTLKNAVAVTLVACGVLTGLILFTGLVFGSATLDKLSKNKAELTGDKADPSIVDASSNGANGEGETTSTDGSSSASNGNTSSGGATTGSTSGSTGTAGNSSSGTKTSGGTTTGGGGTAAAAASISSFTASPSSISYNSASTLSWASANASSCSISTLGSVGASGSKSTGNLTATKTYTLTCGTASKNVTVSVGAAPIACGSKGGVCTSAQVAAHASQGDCWIMLNGYYYIVTPYVNGHSGGKAAFNSSTCGHDITSYWNGISGTPSGSKLDHRQKPNAVSDLSNLRIGEVRG